MTLEEFNKLSKEELHKMSEIDILKHYIKFTEERYISYKNLLEEEYKDKTVYEPGDWRIEFRVWFKEHLREMKNYEESSLKKLHLELKYGGSLPFWLTESWLAKKKRIQCDSCNGKGFIED